MNGCLCFRLTLRKDVAGSADCNERAYSYSANNNSGYPANRDPSNLPSGFTYWAAVTVTAPASSGLVDESPSATLVSGDEIVYDDALDSLGEDGYIAIASELDMFRKKITAIHHCINFKDISKQDILLSCIFGIIDYTH